MPRQKKTTTRNTLRPATDEESTAAWLDDLTADVAALLGYRSTAEYARATVRRQTLRDAKRLGHERRR